MKASTRSSNLWAILADDDDIWHVVREMAMTMESIEKEDIRGFFRASMLDPSQQELIDESTAKPVQLNEQEYQSLCKLINHEHPTNDHERFVLSRQALSVQRISIRGVSYSTSGSRDCNIMFQPSDQPTSIHLQKAGVIQKIFQYSSIPHDKVCYLAVRKLGPINTSHGYVDPFQKYGFAGGFLCDGRTSTGQLCVIRALQVISHFASTEMRGALNNHLIHVLPLDRVRNNSPC